MRGITIIIICVSRSVGCSCRAELVDHGALGLVETVQPELGCWPRLGLGLVLVRHLPFPRREAVLRGAHQRSSGQVTKQRTVNIGIMETLSLFLKLKNNVKVLRPKPTCQGMSPRCPARGRRCRCGDLRGGGGRPGTARGCRCARRQSSRGCARRPSPRSRGPACRSRCSLSRSLLAASFGSLRARWSDLWSPGWASAGNCGRTSLA